jgi:hypothetical protein
VTLRLATARGAGRQLGAGIATVTVIQLGQSGIGLRQLLEHRAKHGVRLAIRFGPELSRPCSVLVSETHVVALTTRSANIASKNISEITPATYPQATSPDPTLAYQRD